MDRKALEKLQPGLPATWYRDPAHYERELQAFWYSRWIAVGREEELPHPGDWRSVRIGTQSVVVLRAADGALRAIHNTCSHRGSGQCTH
jgi:Rieske 2Fe-2S family protein